METTTTTGGASSTEVGVDEDTCQVAVVSLILFTEILHEYCFCVLSFLLCLCVGVVVAPVVSTVREPLLLHRA